MVIDGRRYWDGGFGEKTPLVPFLDGPGVDVVVISHMPHSDKRHKKRGPTAILPSPASLFAGIPPDERLERDIAGIAALEERKPGETIELVVLRDGAERRVSVTLSAAP